jgi:3',5'-cyclic AMP phosphodiesterase CpdA
MSNELVSRRRLIAKAIASPLLLLPGACANVGGGSAGERSATKPASRPVVAEWSQRPLPPGEVNLVVFGDFGNGKRTQRETARAMAEYVERVGTQFDALLTVGDNFYVKMRDADDYQFQSLFEDMYDARRINFPWYVTSGNHDYEKNDKGRTKVEVEQEYARKHPGSRWKYPAKYYRVDFPQGGGGAGEAGRPLVTALMLESSMPHQTRAEWQEQKRWIAEQLATTTALWKIACAHHPFFSNGSHGDNGVMQMEWGPIFKAGGLDFYLAGHDHDLQHLEIPGWPISFVQAGGGGQPVTDMRRDVRGPFSRKVHGFAHVRFLADKAEVRYVNAKDVKVVHRFERTRDGVVTVVTSSGRDRATTKPLKTLIGAGETDVKK